MINIDTERDGELMTIKVVGDVDASSSIELDNAIKQTVNDGLKKILVNGQELHYISSAGLGVFMSYLQDFKKQDIKMALYGLNDKVENVTFTLLLILPDLCFCNEISIDQKW